MAFGVFPQKTEAEKFVRAHCMFVSTYFANPQKALFCSVSAEPFSRALISGEGLTEDDAWNDAEKKVAKHLAYLETLASTISEVNNSSLPSKEFLGGMLMKKYRKLSRGIRLLATIF